MAAGGATRTWDGLVDRLAAHDIRYLMGPSGGSATRVDPSIAALALDLARSEHARLRDALIALLLRHPKEAPEVEAAGRLSHHDPAGRLLLLSLVVASALQSEWGFSLKLYLPHCVPIEVDRLCAELRLPPPGQDFGRPCQAAAARLLRRDAPFPYNYETGWEDVVRRLLAQLARDARHAGA